MSKFVVLCLLIVPLAQGFSLLHPGRGASTGGKTHRELEEEIVSNYTKLASEEKFKMIPPVTPDENGAVGPIQVKIDSYIRDIQMKTVDTDLYHWTAELTFRQKWNDKRLAYDASSNPEHTYIPLTEKGQSSIWKPDTFFSASVKGDFHFLTAPNSFVWVYPNGDVLYSTRVTVVLRCHPQNNTVPAPKENEAKTLTCPMRVTSYGYTTDKLVYDWQQEEPIQFKSDLYIPHYSLSKVTTEKGAGKTKIGEFSALTAKFEFTHE